jgi:hypothetical protein
MTARWLGVNLDAHGQGLGPPSFGTLVPQLAAEFPAYDFGTQRTWNGVSLVAILHGGAAEAGTYAVVTSDPDEMRDVLMSDTRETPPRLDVSAEREQ